MAQSIAEAAKDNKRGSKMKKQQTVRIRGIIRPKNDVFIKIVEPANYPKNEFLFKSMHKFAWGDRSNYTKNGKGDNARYYVTVKGGGNIFEQNMCDLPKYYPQYDWDNILSKYPTNAKGYDAVTAYLREKKAVSPRSIFEYNGDLLICGNQPNDDTIGLIYELYRLDATDYLENKNLVSATIVAPPQTVETLKTIPLLAGNANEYQMRLENCCLKQELAQSQKLNNILSSNVMGTTKDTLDIIDRKVARGVGVNGSTNPPSGAIDVQNTVIWGPNGFKSTVEALSEQKWDETPDSEVNKKEYSMVLQSNKYLNVFGTKNGIRKRKQGQFFVQSLKLTIELKKRNGKLIKCEKIKILYVAQIGGKLTRADGAFQFLRTGQ